MIAALSLLASAFVRQTPITFEPPMGRVSLIVDALAAQTGQKLATSTNLGDTVVFLRAKDQPVEKVMAQLARICLADWKDVGGTLYLSRSETKVAAQEKKDIETVYQAIRKEVDEACAKMPKPMTEQERVDQMKKQETFYQRARNDFRASEAFWKETQVREPGSVAILFLLKDIDLHRIAAMKPGDRLVYSSNPTPMQLPLGANTLNVFKRFVIDQETNYRASIRVQQASGNANAEMIEDIDRRIRELQPAKGVLLSVEKDSNYFDAASTRVTLQMIDAKGQNAGWGNYALGSSMNPMFNSIWMTKEQGDEQPDSNQVKPIELNVSAETRKMFNAMIGVMSDSDDAESPKLDKSVADRFMNPITNDPLTVIFGEVLTEYARKKDLSMVARIDDPYFLLGPGIAKGGKITDQSVEQAFGDRLGKDADSGWTQILPSSPRQALAENESRLGIDKLLKILASKQQPTIWDIGNYGLGLSQGNTFPLATVMMWLAFQSLDTEGPDNAGGNPNDPGLCLLTLLGDQNRKRLAAGQQMTYAQLSPLEQEYVRRLTFGVNRTFTAGGTPDAIEERAEPAARPEASPVADERVNGEEEIDTLDYEPTQILYRGIPMNSRVKLTARTENVVFAKSSDKRMSQDFQLDLQTIAYYLAYERRPDLFKQEDGEGGEDGLTWWKNMTGFYMGSRTNYQITIQFDKSHFSQGYATEIIRDKGSKLSKLDQLPKAVADEINKQVTEMIKQLEEAKKNKGKEGGDGPVGSDPPGTKP